MLLTIVYVSSARREFQPGELLALLEQCRRRNASLGITGLLLHVGGNFMQALEGPAAEVDARFERIARDPRHAMVTKIVRLPIERRLFPGWPMGFREIRKLPQSAPVPVDTFLADIPATPATEGGGKVPPPVLMLLQRFATTMR
jgi:hypothetical protein